jgi:hypothetical protein
MYFRTLGKSWGVFLVAIFIARQMADAEAEQALELAAQKAVPSLCVVSGEATNTNFSLWFDPTDARTHDLPHM